MKRCLLLLLLWPSVALGGALEDGVQAMESGEIDAAISTWEAVASGGSASGLVHYNLGVAYYHRGDLPRAVAHWRSARRQRPRDAAIGHNLALARSRLESVPPPVPGQVGWLGFFTVGEVGLLATLLLAWASAWGWSRRRRGVDPAPALVPAVLGIAVGLASLGAARRLVDEPIAVVVDAPAQVRDMASVDGRSRYELAAGSEIQVEARLGDFLLVHTSDGHRGWIPVSATVLVLPVPAS